MKNDRHQSVLDLSSKILRTDPHDFTSTTPRVFFVSFTSLVEHMWSPAILLFVDSVGGFRLCTLTHHIPEEELIFLVNQGFAFCFPGLANGTTVSSRQWMLQLSAIQSSFTEVISQIYCESISISVSKWFGLALGVLSFSPYFKRWQCVEFTDIFVKDWRQH